MPVAACSRVSPVRVSVRVTPVTLPSPWIVVTAEFQAKLILGLSLARWAMMREARSSPLRTTTVTDFREAGQERRFLHGRIAAADHDDVLVAEEEPVAGGAPGDTVAAELLLLGQAEFLVGGAGGEDDGGRLVGLAGAGDHALEVTGERHFGDVVEHHLRAEPLRPAAAARP